MAISLAGSFIIRFSKDFSESASIVFAILNFFIQIFISMGTTYIYAKLGRDESITLSDLFSQFSFKKLFKLLIAMILWYLVIVIGFLLFILPGIYLGLRLIFVPILIVDKDCGIFEAFSISSEMTNGAKLDILFYQIVGFILVILGLIALIIGAFVAGFAVFIGFMYIYNDLYNKKIEGYVEYEPVIESE